MNASSRTSLADHRIETVETYRLRTRWPRIVGRNARLEEHGYGRECLVRRIVTDQGTSGWGLCRLQPEQTPAVTGMRLSDVFDPALGVTSAEAMPLDFALHDLAGVVLSMPVYQMLGSAGLTAMGVYDAMIYMDDITPAYAPGGVAVVLDHCQHDYDLGYRSFKLKIGRGHRWMPPEDGLQRDIEVTRAVCDHLPDCQIMVDANNGFDCDGFLRYFDAVADCGLFAVEEPFHENRDDLSRLRDHIDRLSPATRIVEGESRTDIDLLLTLGAEGLIDILNVDIAGYGFTRWRALAPRAIECGLALSPHTFDVRLKTYYASHLVAGVGSGTVIEGVIDEIEGVNTDAYRFADGTLQLPDRPGFGMDLIWGRRYDEHGLDDSGHRLVM